MNNIFAIRNDNYSFQELDLMIDDIVDARPPALSEDAVLDFSLTNCEMSDWWPMPDTEFIPIDDDSAPIPDIAKWIDASLVLSPKAYRLLGDTLKEYGELLPITVKKETYYIFNCRTFGQVKKELCEKSYYDGEEAGIKTIVFDLDDVSPKLVFKTDYNAGLELYCGERLKKLVEDFGLRGVIFSSELVQFSS